ncbi:hypothetical protein F4824DRAFT_502260 [Ustulina deusta]|nr:hypothetical protein F4824DRAFT_502260 [Ustulina deusta]
MYIVPSPGTIREKFGPPSYFETLLSAIGEGEGKINEASTNAIKVTNRAGAEASLCEQVKVFKDKYDKIQTKNIQIIQETCAFAQHSETAREELGDTVELHQKIVDAWDAT